MKETKRPLARGGLCLLLICALLISICPAALAKAAPVPLPEDKMLISQTDYDIAPGMTESQVIMNNAEGSEQILGYMATISPGAISRRIRSSGARSFCAQRRFCNSRSPARPASTMATRPG